MPRHHPLWTGEIWLLRDKYLGYRDFYWFWTLSGFYLWFVVQNMSSICFTKSFTQQEPIPEIGIQRAVEILETGRLHRYNLVEGEANEVSELETEYANWQGVNYC